MKTVYSSHSELAAAFAEQSAPHGRGSKMFFEGKKLYSHGHHYLLAEIKHGVLVVNDTPSSVSTGQHRSHACRVWDGKVFNLSTTDPEKFLELFEEEVGKRDRSRKYGEHTHKALERRAREFAEWADISGEISDSDFQKVEFELNKWGFNIPVLAFES